MNRLATQSLSIEMVDGIDDAPKYEYPEFTGINATKAIIVPRGQEGGNPTVDIQFEDGNGNKYVMLITGNLVEMLGELVKQKRIQTNTH